MKLLPVADVVLVMGSLTAVAANHTEDHTALIRREKRNILRGSNDLLAVEKDWGNFPNLLLKKSLQNEKI